MPNWSRLMRATYVATFRNRSLSINFDNLLSFQQVHAFCIMPNVFNCLRLHCACNMLVLTLGVHKWALLHPGSKRFLRLQLEIIANSVPLECPPFLLIVIVFTRNLEPNSVRDFEEMIVKCEFNFLRSWRRIWRALLPIRYRVRRSGTFYSVDNGRGVCFSWCALSICIDFWKKRRRKGKGRKCQDSWFIRRSHLQNRSPCQSLRFVVLGRFGTCFEGIHCQGFRTSAAQVHC